MPFQSIFSTKFLKKQRRKLDFHAKAKKPNNDIVLELGENKAEFVKGQWKLFSVNPNERDYQNLLEKYEESREENNLLKVKIEVLLDMLTQATTACNNRIERVQELEEFISKKLNIDLNDPQSSDNIFNVPEEMYKEALQIFKKQNEMKECTNI